MGQLTILSDDDRFIGDLQSIFEQNILSTHLFKPYYTRMRTITLSRARNCVKTNLNSLWLTSRVQYHVPYCYIMVLYGILFTSPISRGPFFRRPSKISKSGTKAEGEIPKNQSLDAIGCKTIEKNEKEGFERKIRHNAKGRVQKSLVMQFIASLLRM